MGSKERAWSESDSVSGDTSPTLDAAEEYDYGPTAQYQYDEGTGSLSSFNGAEQSFQGVLDCFDSYLTDDGKSHYRVWDPEWEDPYYSPVPPLRREYHTDQYERLFACMSMDDTEPTDSIDSETPEIETVIRLTISNLDYLEVDRLTGGYLDMPCMLEGLRISLQEFSNWLRGRTGEASGDRKGKRPANLQTDRFPSRSAKRKCPVGSGDEQAGDNQGDEQQGKKPRLKSGEVDDEGPFLACPFYKRNSYSHSRCLLFRLKRIGDVKQHLRRKHQQPHYCVCCGDQFESQAALKSHYRGRSCAQADFDEPEGVSEDQSKRLASKVSRRKKEAEQWFEVWAILFPDTQPPSSAYVESPALEILSSFREYWDERGEDVVTKHLQQTLSGITVPTEQNQLKELLPVLLNESVGMLLDRFTQRYTGTPSSVPDTGVSSTPNSNAVQAEDTIPSTPSNLLFLNKSYPTPTTETAPLAEILKDLNVQQQDGSSMGDPSLPIHSSHLTSASSTAAIDHSELQEDYPEWTTAFPGILQDSDMYFFDTCFDSLVSQDAS